MQEILIKKTALSIIIPCYNCKETIKEAVDSCFKQNLGENFEIIMVDDGSTDNTRDILYDLAKKYKNIKIYFHEKNRGGGATRNTAVTNSNSDTIFCLDSDDILVENTLSRMLNLLQNKKCDGILFEGGLSFKIKKNKNTKNNFKGKMDGPITIKDYFGGTSGGITANFMFKKSAHAMCGGYPTHHNFDTQGFGLRFLINNFIAYVCPDTYFYQRQFAKKLSYFERAYNSGEYSVGYFFIFLELMHLFSRDTINYILSYNIFNHNRLGESNIYNDVLNIFKSNPEAFFNDSQQDESFQKKLKVANEYMISENYIESLLTYYDILSVAQENERNNIRFLMIYIISVIKNPEKRHSKLADILNTFSLKKIASTTKRPNIFKRLHRKIIKTFI